MPIEFVLVAPRRPANVGASARAIKTMGFRQLVVVDSDAHHHPECAWVAHGAGDILQTVASQPDLESALRGVTFSVATTARQRGRRHHYYDAGALKRMIAAKFSGDDRIAILFGSEESGLSNAQIDCCDVVSGITLAADYPSLNLAQAVMLYAYELSPLLTSAQATTPIDSGSPDDSYRHLVRRVDRLLELLGVEQEESLARWVRERLPLAERRDIKLLHLLLRDIERQL